MDPDFEVRPSGSRRGVLLSALALGLGAPAAEVAAAAAGPEASGRGAAFAPTRYVQAPGRRLAYRTVGRGAPMVLCTRFRGNLDSWDPLFLDSLAAQGFQVITFDYSGLGLSSGDRSVDPAAWARDAQDLIHALNLKSVVLVGWSLGGVAAQIALGLFPDRISHLVLIGTTPPGPVVKLAEPLFYAAAARENDFEDEVILFFEPSSPRSREAARRSHDRIAARKADLSPPVPHAWAAAGLGDKPKAVPFPAPAILEILKTTRIPILHIGGDHDPICPVENWYALNGQLPTLELLTYPRSGHGPQHQHPVASATYVGTFVRETRI